MALLRITIFLLLLTSCGNKKIERAKLFGRYTWNDGRADTLELRVDGAYEYWMHKPGRRVANSGTWKYDSTTNEVEFERENLPFLAEQEHNGSWFSPVRSSGDEVHLMYKKDGDKYLKQIKTSKE